MLEGVPDISNIVSSTLTLPFKLNLALMTRLSRMV